MSCGWLKKYNFSIRSRDDDRRAATSQSGAIKRSDFGMTKYVPMISDDVKIHVPVEAYKN